MDARRMEASLRAVLLAVGSTALFIVLFAWILARTALGGPGDPYPDGGNSAARVAGEETWTVEAMADFARGELDGLALHAPGSMSLDSLPYPDTQVNDTPVTDARWAPRVAWSQAANAWLVVWADERQADHSPDIFLARSSDGRSWSEDILVDDDCDPNEAPLFPSCPTHDNPDLAVQDVDGSVWVVWQQAEADDTDAGNIYYARSNDHGDSWEDKGTVTTAAGKQHRPRLVEAGGVLFTIWEDEGSDDGDIRIARFNPATDSAWGTSIQVSDDTGSAEQYAPALAADSAGNLYAVWVDRRADPNDGHVYFARWLNGSSWATGSWSASVPLSDLDVDWGLYPDILVAPDDSLYVAWVERVEDVGGADYRLMVARSTDQGQTWSRSQVHRLADQALGFYARPSLAADEDRVMVAWLHSPDAQVSTSDVLWSISYDQGDHWTQPRRLNRQSTVDVASHPHLAVNDAGQVVAAWQDWRSGSGPQIYAATYPGQRYVRSGTYRATKAPGDAVRWNTLVWTATVPSGARLDVYTRVSPDGTTWLPWRLHTTSPADLEGVSGEQIQVRMVLTATAAGLNTPVVDGFQVTYETIEAPPTDRSVYLPLIQRQP